MWVMMVGGCCAGGVQGCCDGWCCSSRLLGCPIDRHWCLVCELCRLTVVCVDCRCFLFLGSARRLELYPCNTLVLAVVIFSRCWRLSVPISGHFQALACSMLFLYHVRVILVLFTHMHSMQPGRYTKITLFTFAFSFARWVKPRLLHTKISHSGVR